MSEVVFVRLLLLVALLLGVVIGCDCGREHFRDEAADAGHAEYYLDANHNKQWRWKEAK